MECNKYSSDTSSSLWGRNTSAKQFTPKAPAGHNGLPPKSQSYLNSPRSAYVNTQSSPISNIDLHERLVALELKLTEEGLITKATQESEVYDCPPCLDEEVREDIKLNWCPYCRRETVTTKVYRNSSKTFWSSVAIFLSGGFLGCFLLPYACNKCKDDAYQCKRCKHYK